MIVFVVIFACDYVRGVFSSRERAQKYIDSAVWQKDVLGDDGLVRSEGEGDHRDYDIEPYILDDPDGDPDAESP